MSAVPNNAAPTPLHRKLGITPGTRVALIGAPPGFADQLEGALINTLLRGSFDVIIQFATSRATLERRLDALVAALEPRGGLWYRVAEAQLGQTFRPRRSRRPRERPGHRAGRQQGLRHRRDLVGAPIRHAPGRSLNRSGSPAVRPAW
jgi:hypothetical protein